MSCGPGMNPLDRYPSLFCSIFISTILLILIYLLLNTLATSLNKNYQHCIQVSFLVLIVLFVLSKRISNSLQPIYPLFYPGCKSSSYIFHVCRFSSGNKRMERQNRSKWSKYSIPSPSIQRYPWIVSI